MFSRWRTTDSKITIENVINLLGFFIMKMVEVVLLTSLTVTCTLITEQVFLIKWTVSATALIKRERVCRTPALYVDDINTVRLSVFSEVAQAAQLRENLGMLVWIPSSCLNHTQCKSAHVELMKQMFDAPDVYSLFCVAVDEYVNIAKEKHGYNMEQVHRRFHSSHVAQRVVWPSQCIADI